MVFPYLALRLTEFTQEGSYDITSSSVFFIFCDINVFKVILIMQKIFQSDRIQGGSHNKLTAYYGCSNADLNLILAAATTNRFMFENYLIINSLMESMGVCLTWHDCKVPTL